MKHLTRWFVGFGRWALYLAFLAVLHGLPYVLILRVLLGWGVASSPIASTIGTRLGVRATVADSIVVWWRDSSLHGLRLYEPDQDEPFLVADEAIADLNILGYLRKRPLSRVDLTGVHVRLRFDATGKLLTRLAPPPGGDGNIPALRVRNGTFTIAQEGRSPFTLTGITLTLNPGKPYELVGIIDDPHWGRVDVAGTMNSRTLATTLKLDSPGLDIHPACLRTVPFVPPATWERIELHSDNMPVRLELTMGKTIPKVRYQLGFSELSFGLKQPDRPTFTVSGAAGELKGNEEGFRLDGTIADAKYGKWTAEARYESKRGDFDLTLTTPNAAVDQAKLVALPYVPKSVWQQVQVDQGETAAKVNVRFSTRKFDVHYRVDLDVKRADLRVPVLDLPLRGTSGEVIVEDGQVWLKRVVGRAAEGALTGQSEMDFRTSPPVLKFGLAIDQVRLGKLPEKWELPARIVDGRLRGQADLVVTWRGDKIHPTGSGTGRIDDARLLGFPAREPIELDLHADGTRIGIEPRSPVLKKLLKGAGVSKAPTWAPQDMAAQVGVGVATATRQIGDGASWAMTMLGAKGGERPVANRSYLDAGFALEEVDLDEVFRRLEITLPPSLRLAGKLSLRIRVGVPVDLPAEIRAFRLDGEVALQRLSINAVELRNLLATVEYRDGILVLDRLTGDLGAGSFSGRAKAAVYPRGDVVASLNCTQLPLDGLAGKGTPLGGSVSGRMRVEVPLAKVGNAQAWRGRAALREARIEAAGIAAHDLSANVTLAGGVLEVVDLRGELARAPLSGSARLTLTGTMPVVADLRIRGLDLSALGSALPEMAVAGVADVSGTVSGSVYGQGLKGTAQVTARNLRASGLRAESVSLRVVASEEKVEFVDIDTRLYRGRVSGTATLFLPSGAGLGGRGEGGEQAARDRPALKGRGYTPGESPVNRAVAQAIVAPSVTPVTQPGSPGFVEGVAQSFRAGRAPSLRLDLTATDLDAHALAASFPALTVPVAGKLSAQARVVARPEGKRWCGEVSASAKSLLVQGVAVTNLKGRLAWKGKKTDYRLTGHALSGEVSVEGSYPAPANRPAGRYDGRVTLDRVLLRGLAEALGKGETLRQLDGVAWVEIPYNHVGLKMSPQGQGRVVLRDVRLADRELMDNLVGYLRLSDDGIYLRDVSAFLAGGLLRIQGAYRFSDPSRSWFTLHLHGAESARLTRFDPNSKELLSGPINLSLRGSMGPECSGSGSLVLTRGRIMGVEVSECRLPLEFRFAARQGRLEFGVRDATAQLGNGRAILNAQVVTGGATRIEGNVRFFDAGLRSLAGLAGDVSSYVSGRVTGRVDFAGADMTSLDDLNATIQASLSDSQALQLPVLKLVTPYLLPGQGAATFQTGEIRARLARGVLRISELALESPLVRIMLQGNVTLRQTRLDLAVIAETSPLNAINPLAVRLLLRRLPPVGPVPVGLVVQVTELLATRAVFLHVTGTVKSPVVQVAPLRTLSDEAVRFFLGRAIGPVPTGP